MAGTTTLEEEADLGIIAGEPEQEDENRAEEEEEDDDDDDLDIIAEEGDRLDDDDRREVEEGLDVDGGVSWREDDKEEERRAGEAGEEEELSPNSSWPSSARWLRKAVTERRTTSESLPCVKKATVAVIILAASNT